MTIDLLAECTRSAALIREAAHGPRPDIVRAAHRAAEMHDPGTCPCTIGAHDTLMRKALAEQGFGSDPTKVTVHVDRERLAVSIARHLAGRTA